MNSIRPPLPPGAWKGAGNASLATFLAWAAWTLVQLQTGQADLDRRLQAIERRLPEPPPLAVGVRE